MGRFIACHRVQHGRQEELASPAMLDAVLVRTMTTRSELLGCAATAITGIDDKPHRYMCLVHE